MGKININQSGYSTRGDTRFQNMVDDGTNAAISAILLLQLSNQVQRLALGDHRQQPRILLTVEGRLGRRCWITAKPAPL